MTTALVGYYEGDHLRLRYRANAAPASVDAFILYEDDDQPGRFFKDTAPQVTTFTTTWAETLIEGDVSGGASSCKITGGGVLLRSSATSLVKGSMYVRLVLARQESAYEECLCCGYIYDAKPFLSVGEHADIEFGDNAAFMDVTYTQANVAGGAIVVEITPGAGNALQIVAGRIVNSGTNGIRVDYETAAGGSLYAILSSIGSGAATSAHVGPGLVSTTPTTTANVIGYGPEARVWGTHALKIYQTVAGAQNDTLRILLTIRVKGALPTVTKANSTNEADVTVTAGAASFAFVS